MAKVVLQMTGKRWNSQYMLLKQLAIHLRIQLKRMFKKEGREEERKENRKGKVKEKKRKRKKKKQLNTIGSKCYIKEYKISTKWIKSEL